ncbi:ADP-ribosylglycohydrolase family protein [Pseudoalteromonas sp. SR44-5]|uniref:ADP-ribosylglycohydrolase family protein n=1 Tax=unclassified Pseudoalteromonas TaxID=194690 RepID=UPI001603BCBF|nr:ADP-ribosylglycohydrolase family protein [Pseudoalteromonas sp. SR44-5]MBB1367555.1 ADP-ribosylglycohydrolase family protein [Pseudoalteromonas sp. SR44-5]
MLVEIAIADAYGAGFEFVDQEIISAENNLETFRAHQLSNIAGCYTDDTQMSLALSELMLNDVDWTEAHIAEAFFQCYIRDPVHGYAKRLQTAFSEARNADHFARLVKTDSFGNGAMMRAVPIGFFKDEDVVIRNATIQARVTHDHQIAVDAAVCIALAPHAGLYSKATLKTLPEYLASRGYKFNANWQGRVRAVSEDTLAAVMSNLMQHFSYEALIKSAVDFGGDTDSVASICCGIASCYDGVDKTLPNKLVTNFSKDNFGLDYLRDLDIQLKNKFL